MLFSEEVGADALPMRFAAAAILMAIILALSYTALADFIKGGQVMRFSSDLAAFEDRASVIYQQGGARDISNPADHTGTKENISFTIPGTIDIVVLGAMPPQNKGVPSTAGPYESNIIYYTTYRGVTYTITSGARYATGLELDKPIILTSGTYELTCELVRNSAGTFITLY